jgi:hypothetical protein
METQICALCGKANVRRGNTYSIIDAMTLDGWLPCTVVKRGYYSKELFVHWLKEHPNSNPEWLLIPWKDTRCGVRQLFYPYQ